MLEVANAAYDASATKSWGGDNVGWITQCLESGHTDCSDVCCALCNAMAIGINNIPSLPPLVDPVGSWGLDESHQFTPLPVVQSLLSTVLLSFIIHHWLIFCSFCGLRHQNPYCSLAVSLDPSGDFWQTPLPKPALKNVLEEPAAKCFLGV